MNTTLTGLFTLECAMKIYSYGFRVGVEPWVCEGWYNMTAETAQTQTHHQFLSQFFTVISEIPRPRIEPRTIVESCPFHISINPPFTFSQFRGHTDDQINMMEAFSAAFTVFFTLESLLKIAASGWRVCSLLCYVVSWCLNKIFFSNIFKIDWCLLPSCCTFLT